MAVEFLDCEFCYGSGYLEGYAKTCPHCMGTGKSHRAIYKNDVKSNSSNYQNSKVSNFNKSDVEKSADMLNVFFHFYYVCRNQ